MEEKLGIYISETNLPSSENGVVLTQRMVLGTSEWLQLDQVVMRDHPLKLHVQEMYTFAGLMSTCWD